MNQTRRCVAPIVTTAFALGVFICCDVTVNADELADQSAGVEIARVEPERRAALVQSSGEVRDEVAPVNPLSVISLEQLGHTIKRPLFTTTRRPPQIIKKKRRVVTKKPKKKPDTKAFGLIGVVSGNGISLALLQQKSTGAILRLQAGDAVHGWRVQRVGPTDVTLVQEETTVSLTLFPK